MISKLRMKLSLYNLIVGIVIGVILSSMLVYLGIFSTDWKADQLSNNLIVVISTFIAAWAGGMAAFKSERNAQETFKEQERIAALNKAFFVLSQIAILMDNLKLLIFNENSKMKSEYRALELDSPPTGMLPDIRFKHEELVYLLEVDDQTVDALISLSAVEWKYQICISCIEHRAKCYEEFSRLLETENATSFDYPSMKNMFNSQFMRPESITDSMVSAVSECNDETKEAYAKLKLASKKMFKDKEFLEIEEFNQDKSKTK